MNKQRNPDVDWGFHATIPRVVRTEYKDLTPVQKWLYVCLKDLCGDYGTCYRTLRVLAEETGISTGMLSESIRKLHEAGLIHAEKKKRQNTSSKEVWHITVVDIWSANAKAHPTKRSQNEHSQENVHTVNNNVHRMNDIPEECSADEQKRSLCETEVITLSNNNIEEITEKDTYVNADALTRTQTENNNQSQLSTNETTSQHDIHTEQPSADYPIATTKPQTELIGVATRNTDSLPEVTQAAVPNKPPKPPKQNVPPGPLEMPPDDARWCAEIAVQIVEFKKGRRYGEVTRKQELEKARQVLKYEINGALLTRAQFTHAWDRMNEWPLWVEKNIAPMIKHLLKDDRIISLVQQKAKTPSGALTNGQKPRASVLLPEHIANERKRKLLESTAAQRAEMDARQAARLAQTGGK